MATKKNSSNNSGLLIIAIIVLAVGVLIWIAVAIVSRVPVINTTLKDSPAGTVPAAMPHGIILAGDAKILHSYTATLPQGTLQSTVIYQTQQAPGDLLQQYNNYLLKAGWWPVQTSQIQIVAPSQMKTPAAVRAAGGIAIHSSSTIPNYMVQFSMSSSTISVNILPNGSDGWMVSINMNSPQ